MISLIKEFKYGQTNLDVRRPWFGRGPRQGFQGSGDVLFLDLVTGSPHVHFVKAC